MFRRVSIRVGGLFSALVIGLASCASLMAVSPVAAATVPKCVWFGGGPNDLWSTASNWSCTSGNVPSSGDDLVFPSVLSYTSVNDISGLTLHQLVLSDSQNIGIQISGQPISLTDGIVDTSNLSQNFDEIDLTINLAGDQTFTLNQPAGSQGIELGNGGDLNLNGYNLTLSSTGQDFYIEGNVVGAGTLTTTANQPEALFQLLGDNSNFSGALVIQGGSVEAMADPTSLGTAKITVASGGNLSLGIFFGNIGPAVVANNFTLAGSGNIGQDNGSLALMCFSEGPCTTSANLTGNITLTNNTQFKLTGVNTLVSGPVAGCYAISKTASSDPSTLTGNLKGTGCTAPATPVKPVNHKSLPAPKAPDTGVGSYVSNVWTTVFVTGIAALSLSGCALLLHKRYN